MAASLIRDTAFGHLVRLVTRNKFLQYEEEKDPSLWKRYLDREKSANMAKFGRSEGLGPEEKKIGSDSNNNSTPELSDDPDSNKLAAPASHANSNTAPPNHQLSSTLTNVAVDPEKGRDVGLVGWWGDNDPENPMNWSSLRKAFVTFELCLLTFSVYIGSAIYSAGIESVVKDFGVSQTKATLGLTLFVAGYGLGPVLWAPMSEIPQIGRNPVYIGTLIVFVIFQVPTALPVNFAMLLCFRFLTGFIGSPCLATGGASIADMYAPNKRAYGIGLWGIAAVCGPVLGPLVGGFAAQAKGWSWTIWELMWLSGFALIIFIFFLPETSSTNILYRRTRRLRKLTGNDTLKCEPEIESETMTGKEIAMITLVRPITLSFGEPIVFALNLYIALIYGLLYIWFESFPLVFIQIYHFNLGQEGLAFIGILMGAILVIPFYFYYVHKYQEPFFDENGQLQPELRLPPAFVGAFFIPACLFIFGWTSRPDVHWIAPIIGSALFTIGAYLLFGAVLLYLGDAYPRYAASVLAGNDLMRSSLGAGFPLFATGMYKNLGIGWASSTLGFISIAFIPLPFLLYRYGTTLRKMSKNARQDY